MICGTFVSSPYIFPIRISLNRYSTCWLSSLTELTSLTILLYRFMHPLDQPPKLAIAGLVHGIHWSKFDLFCIFVLLILLIFWNSIYYASQHRSIVSLYFIGYSVNIRKCCGILFFLFQFFTLKYVKYLLI